MKGKGFTLAEGATHTNMLQRVSNGFTLAEILITLAIIGVVAAMTIPTLIAKINSIVTDNQMKVFNAKLIKGLNLTKTAGDLNNTYTSTYDFLVNGLGKNLKMAKVCDKNNIKDCIPYDKVKYEDKSGNEKTINVADIKTVDKLNLKAPYMDPAAFVLADGTPVIVSYNKECIDDPDKADTTINACLAGIYDLNGSRKPNKYGVKVVDEKTSYTNDLIAFNGASIGSSCAGQIGDVCLASTAVMANKTTILPLIQAVDPSYTMPKDDYYDEDEDEYYQKNDYWQLAVDYCDKVQNGAHLPSSSDLAKIARVLYGDNTILDINESNIKNGLDWTTNKSDVFAALGIESTESSLYLWSSEPDGSEMAYYRYFDSTGTEYHCSARDYGNRRVICLGD